MNYDTPTGSSEKNTEVPATLKTAFDKEQHNILGEKGLEVTSDDVEEFNGLIAEGSSVEEIQAVRDNFNNQFDQAATEFNIPETTEPRRKELGDLMVKLLHKIATGEAAINSKNSEPKGKRYEGSILQRELNFSETELGKATSIEERAKIRGRIEELKAKQTLNRQKLEAKMGQMDPTDRQRLAELDSQNAGIRASKNDLEKRRTEQERMFKDGMQPEFRAVYEETNKKLDTDWPAVSEEISVLEEKYNI